MPRRASTGNRRVKTLVSNVEKPPKDNVQSCGRWNLRATKSRRERGLVSTKKLLPTHTPKIQKNAVSPASSQNSCAGVIQRQAPMVGRTKLMATLLQHDEVSEVSSDDDIELILIALSLFILDSSDDTE